MTNRWLLIAVCMIGLASLPLFGVWRVAVERYCIHLREHHPAFLEQTMKQAPRPWGAYPSLLYLTRLPAPDAESEPLRRRARALRRLANVCLGGAATFFALLALWQEVIAG